MGIVENRVNVARRARSAGIGRGRRDRPFAIGPTEVKGGRRWIGELAGGDVVDLFSRVETNVADVEVACLEVKA
jgi:hypothetical protein